MGTPTSAVEPIAEALPAMQALASRLWTPDARHHPGQLAWSFAYGPPEVLHHGPAVVLSRVEGRGGSVSRMVRRMPSRPEATGSSSDLRARGTTAENSISKS